jgi:CRISPR-associated protein Csm5
MATYQVKLSTLSPLHIGEGRELRLGFDFMIYEGQTWRLNEDAILAAYGEQLLAVSGGRYPLPGELLKPADYQQAELFRYVLRGKPRSQKGDARLQSCIKDVYDRPYLPGSSIKGALRTALAWTGWSEMKLQVDRTSFGRSPFWAGQPVEQKIFGPDPNRDLLRALQVSDCISQSAAEQTLLIVNAQVLTPKTPVHL